MAPCDSFKTLCVVLLFAYGVLQAEAKSRMLNQSTTVYTFKVLERVPCKTLEKILQKLEIIWGISFQ